MWGAATPRWRLRELRPGEWWAVDSASGTASALNDAVATRLWALEHLLSEPFAHALREARTSGSIGTFVDLRFAGRTVRYRSQKAALVERVATDFAGAHARLRCTPDAVVHLSPGVNLDRIHRSIEGQRVGVRVGPAGGAVDVVGSTALPIVPLLQDPHYDTRYTAMHAALLATASGGVLVCGQRRAGKTTAALMFSRLALGDVLTDELVLLDASARACGVSLPVRERTGADRISYPLARTDVGAPLVGVDHLVVLGAASADGVAVSRRVHDIVEGLHLAAPHLRPLGGPLGTATDNLLGLLGDARVWHWQCRPWPALSDDLRKAALALLHDDSASIANSSPDTVEA